MFASDLAIGVTSAFLTELGTIGLNYIGRAVSITRSLYGFHILDTELALRVFHGRGRYCLGSF